MAKSKEGRRKFLKNAAATAVAIAGPGQLADAQQSSAADQDQGA